MSVLELPHEYKARNYQEPLFKAFLQEKKRFGIWVAHRRSGKDLSCLNLITAKAMERVGSYYYLFPEIAHARRVIWNGMTKDGKKFLDFIPQAIRGAKPNKTHMELQLINGSQIQLGGADDYDRIMGTNPVGIILSEYSLQNPMALQFLLPIIAENGGWVLLNCTPRGKNHAFKMLQQAQNNPDWFSEVLTVDDTQAISLEEIDKLRKQGMSEAMIQQEFYCSFDAPVHGAYYAEQLKLAQNQGRIRIFEINPGAPTYTFWDLGVRDPMAIWVMQKVNDELRMCFYYENTGGGLKNAFEWLVHLKDKYQLIYMDHYAPHDIENTTLLTGRSIIDECRAFGINFITVRRAKNVVDDINSTRAIFYRVHFHAENCDQGLAALQEYHANYDEKTGWVGDPVHNWASHGADAFRTFGIGWSEYAEKIHSYSGNFVRPDWSP